MTLYVNGTAVTPTATDHAPFASSGSLAIGRGKVNGAAAELFTGAVSNVQVYNRVLSAAEVTTLHTAGSSGGTVASSNAR